jgi:hypothetical protein
MPVPLDVATALEHHILMLPGDVQPGEVEVLAASRFPSARWQRPPDVPDSRDRKRPLSPGTLKLSRLSSLEGPFRLERDVRAQLGVPDAAANAYVLHAPRERGEEPWPGSADPDGLNRAFPDGLPTRDEGRMVDWLVAAARRLGGAVRIFGSNAVLVPDPAAAVNLAVWTDIWLEPDAALAVVRQAVPRAHLDLGRHWSGPPVGTGRIPVPGTEDLDPQVRAALHAAADERDLTALEVGEQRTSYGILASLDHDGDLAVQIAGEDEVPVVLADVPWTSGGAIVYRISWEPTHLEDLMLERPPVDHTIPRGRAAPLVGAVARAVHAAVGGEVTDTMGFIVAPADL